MPYIDLARRFRDLKEDELEEPEFLASLNEQSLRWADGWADVSRTIGGQLGDSAPQLWPKKANSRGRRNSCKHLLLYGLRCWLMLVFVAWDGTFNPRVQSSSR